MKKVALITGGASGLGKTLSKEFAKKGYNLVITYNSSFESAVNLKKEIEDDYHVEVLIIKCDLSLEEDIKNVRDTSISKFERVDVLVNNAAVEIDKEFNEKTKKDFLYTLEVNLVGTFLISRYIGNEMYKNKYGKIINISSNNAIDKNDPITLEYDASKAGIISLTRNLALKYAPYVNVNAVAPGWIMTDKVKKENEFLDNKLVEEESKKILLNRFAKEEDVSNVVLFLASDDSSYINSEVIRIDGGSY